jgi:hypothetical protein
MKKFLLFLLLQLVFSFGAKACFNNFYTLDKNGHAHSQGQSQANIMFDVNFNTEQIVNNMNSLIESMKEDSSYMLLSDYAVDLVKLGKTNEALIILAELYRHYPDEYRIASNLGTVYELHGDLDSALKYIRRGIQLNPDDHYGSEWIHEKILLAKIELRKNKSWLKTHSVLELTDAQRNDSIVCRQLFIQVQERFPFTKPVADPVMASLFYDLGDLYYNTSSVPMAIVCYMTARDYFEMSSPSLDYKIAQAEKLNKEQENIKVPKEGNLHGIVIKEVNFDSRFADNDPKKYKIDWKNIITDPEILLRMVRLDLMVMDVKAIAEKHAGKNGLYPVKDSLTARHDTTSKPKEFSEPASTVKKKDPNRLGNLIWGITAFLIVAGGVVALGRKRKWKRPKD